MLPQDPAQHGEDLPHEQRSEAHRRFIDQENPRVHEERPGDGQHLQLAAREVLRSLVGAFLEDGEKAERIR